MPYLVVHFEKLRIIVSVWILLLDLNSEFFGDDFW